MTKQENVTAKMVQMEVLWWLVTLLIAVAVVLPIYFTAGPYRFMVQNTIFVIVFITFTRYIFLLPFTFLARRQFLKQVLIIACIPAIFFLVQELNTFQTFLDENSMEAIIGPLPMQKAAGIGQYLHAEMLLFAVGAIISAVLLPFRLGLSIWRTRNRGTV